MSTNDPDRPGKIILQAAITPHTIRYRKESFWPAGVITDVEMADKREEDRQVRCSGRFASTSYNDGQLTILEPPPLPSSL